MTLPVNASLLRQRSRIRQRFRSDRPLPGFVVLRDFLREPVLRKVVEGCRKAPYATFCGYTPTGEHKDLRNEFCEPDPRYFYITIHERSRRPISALTELRQAFAREDTLSALSELSGIELARVWDQHALTCWGPGSFLQPHTDYWPQKAARLVLSLSLTRRWQPSYGGTTVFAWRGADRSVRLQPHLNTAVLFTPHQGSRHWVEPVSPKAPPRLRFTWTAFFD